MAQPTLTEFLSNRALLALRLPAPERGGPFRRTFRLPAPVAGLAVFPDGACRRLQPGEDVWGKFDLVLAKPAETPLRFCFPDLRSADGFPVNAAATVSLSLAADRSDLLRDFCRTLLPGPGTFGTAELRAHVGPEIRRLLAEYVAARPARELSRADRTGDLPPLLRDGLERFLFDAGIRCGNVQDVALQSPEYDRQADAERRRAEEERRSARLLELKEERLRRLAGILKDQDVQSLLTRVPDDRLRGLLYAKLMEDDALQITAEDLLAKARDCGQEVVEVIYKAMETLLAAGASVDPAEIEASRAERVFLAAGRRVLEFTPDDDEPPRLHDFREPLRSVRIVETPRGELLVGGSRQHVAARPLEGGELLEYPLPNGRTVRGGINAVALDGDALYATHSEYGLARWDWRAPGAPAELLFPEVTRLHRTTRAVQIAGGRLIFASGPHVYAASVGSSEPPVKYVSSVESPVTCVAAAARTIFAGTESGAILCWKADAPDQPVVLVRRRDAILNLRLARICAIPHLLYSTRDLSVRARVIGQNLETAYESGGATVGILDAASDLVCASDAEGRRLFLWKTTSPARPARELEVWRQSDKPVLDLWIKKKRARSA